MTQTIMSKFAQQFTEIQTLTNTKVVALNKADPKYIRFNAFLDSSYTKGVESDHIKIFKINESQSFAFAFYYINIDSPYLMINFKEEEDIVSAKYSVETAKTKVNEFIKILKVLSKSKQINADNIQNSFKVIFLEGKTEELKQELEDIELSFDNEFSKLLAKNKIKLEKFHLANDEYNEAVNKINKSVETKQKSLKINEIKEQLRQAEEELTKHKATMRVKVDLREKEANKILATKDIMNTADDAKKLMNTLLQKVPKSLSQKVKDKMLKKIEVNFKV